MALGSCSLVALRKSGWEEQNSAETSQGRNSQSRANQPLSSTIQNDTKGKAIAGSWFLLQCGLTFPGGH